MASNPLFCVFSTVLTLYLCLRRPEMDICVVVISTVPGSKVGSPSSCVPKAFFESDNAFAANIQSDIQDVQEDVTSLNFSQIGLMCGHLILAFINTVSLCVRQRSSRADNVPTDGQRRFRNSVFIA